MTLGPRTRKTLKIIAVSYVLKTVLVGLAWFFAPELADRALASVQEVFAVAPAPE
jgi:uncharacterized protein YjeT (DUF2065 family)